jgi:hypothetical protein
MPQSIHPTPDTVAPKPNGNVRRGSGISRLSAAYFLASLLLIYVTAPVFEGFRSGESFRRCS